MGKLLVLPTARVAPRSRPSVEALRRYGDESPEEALQRRLLAASAAFVTLTAVVLSLLSPA